MAAEVLMSGSFLEQGGSLPSALIAPRPSFTQITMFSGFLGGGVGLLSSETKLARDRRRLLFLHSGIKWSRPEGAGLSSDYQMKHL